MVGAYAVAMKATSKSATPKGVTEIKNKIQWKPLLLSIGISLGGGALSGLVTMDAMEGYALVRQPAFAPPEWLFPVVWTVLYLLMGISAYLVWESDAPNRKRALFLYGAQLAVNLVWPVFFFNLHAFGFSFFWLLLLIALAWAMTAAFYRAVRSAAVLQLPYLVWLLFAAALNFSIWIIN